MVLVLVLGFVLVLRRLFRLGEVVVVVRRVVVVTRCVVVVVARRRGVLVVVDGPGLVTVACVVLVDELLVTPPPVVPVVVEVGAVVVLVGAVVVPQGPHGASVAPSRLRSKRAPLMLAAMSAAQNELLEPYSALNTALSASVNTFSVLHSLYWLHCSSSAQSKYGSSWLVWSTCCWSSRRRWWRLCSWWVRWCWWVWWWCPRVRTGRRWRRRG